MASSPRHRVVIVGGGFGGLFAARALRGSADVTLLDRTSNHLFQPLLYQVATGILSEGQISVPLRDVLKRHRNVECVLADVVDVDPAGRTVIADRPDGITDRAGRIQVGDDLTIPGHPEISVIGDVMAKDGLPGVAEVAMQTGLYTGRRIRRHLEGHRPAGPFRYHDLGTAAYLARGRAVVSVGKVHFAGFLGWLVWLLIHIAFLTGYRYRAGAVASWAVTFIRDTRRERTFTTQQIESLRDLYRDTPAPDRRTVAS
jgi:NADH dehydrogenase FAD-containing subunit